MHVSQKLAVYANHTLTAIWMASLMECKKKNSAAKLTLLLRVPHLRCSSRSCRWLIVLPCILINQNDAKANPGERTKILHHATNERHWLVFVSRQRGLTSCINMAWAVMPLPPSASYCSLFVSLSFAILLPGDATSIVHKFRTKLMKNAHFNPEQLQQSGATLCMTISLHYEFHSYWRRRNPSTPKREVEWD